MAAPETPSPLSFRPIGELRALERNARKHPESQLLQLMRLIEEYGFTAPIVADERSILAGHGRLTAATRLYAASKRLSMPDGSGIPDGCVPVLNCSGWSDAKRRAYALADNKVALRSTWDYNLLAVELRELSGLESFDGELLGFNEVELHALTGQKLLPPTPPEPSKTNATDEWQGMPEYEGTAPCHRKIVVNFETQADVEAFFAAIGRAYGPKIKSIWFPHKDRRDIKSLRYADKT